MNSFVNDCNMFGCHPYIIGTYSWSSSGRCAINNVQNPSGSYWWVTPAQFDVFRELKIPKAPNAAGTHWTYTSYVDGVKQVEGVKINDNSVSNIGASLHWFGVFAEAITTTTNVQRPTKCPQGTDIQSISLETEDTMILQYVAKRSVADESMKLDVLHLEKSLKCKVVDAKLEGSCLCNDEVWVVIKYHSPSKSPPVVLKSSPSLKSISRKRRSPELRARRNY